jgi:DNA-binding transcriptional regulator YiaG
MGELMEKTSNDDGAKQGIRDLLSESIRELRKVLGLNQQEFAYRMKTAVRTIARWENGRPPHGRDLVRLAQIADAEEVQHLAQRFVAAWEATKHPGQVGLELQSWSGGLQVDLELQAWSEGLQVAFRYRFRLEQDWRSITDLIVRSVDYASSAKAELGEESRELPSLHRQLMAARARYKTDAKG